MVSTLESFVVSTTFAEWLRAARERRGLEQEDVAALAGTGQSTVSMYERGKRNPRKETVIALADALAFEGESREDRDNRRNSALLAAGFVPNPPAGDQPGIVREAVDRAYHLYTGLSPEGRKEADTMLEWLWERERRRREGDPVEELEDEGDD